MFFKQMDKQQQQHNAHKNTQSITTKITKHEYKQQTTDNINNNKYKKTLSTHTTDTNCKKNKRNNNNNKTNDVDTSIFALPSKWGFAIRTYWRDWPHSRVSLPLGTKETATQQALRARAVP